MKPFALLGKLAKKYSKLIFLTTLTMLGLVGAQLLIPWIIRQLIDRLTTQPLDQGTIDFITRISLIALVVFIASFAFSLGPVVWTVINEIFPGRVRGRAVAFATAVNWGAAFVVSEFFLTLVGAIGESATFWLFAFFCAAGGTWIWKRVPETKGCSLEQIEALWRPDGTPPGAAGPAAGTEK